MSRLPWNGWFIWTAGAFVHDVGGKSHFMHLSVGIVVSFFFWHAEFLVICYVECVNHVVSSLYKPAMYQFRSSLFASRLGKEFGCIFFVCNHERSSSHTVVSLLYVQLYIGSLSCGNAWVPLCNYIYRLWTADG